MLEQPLIIGTVKQRQFDRLTNDNQQNEVMHEKHYQSILANAPFGYAYHRIIVDESGVPVDYEFLEVNQAFELITGLKASEIIGKTISSILPGIRNGSFDWIAQYGKLALEGSEFEFEQFSEPLKSWFRVKASSTEKGFFSTLFTDISEQYKLAGIARTFLTYTPETVDYQYIIDTACEISGAAYGTINIFDEDGQSFTTHAFSGMNQLVKKTAEQLGFQLINKKWKFDANRQAQLKNQKTTIFDSIHQLAGSSLSPFLLETIIRTFNLGKLAVVKTEKNGRMLGDFTLLFTKNHLLQNQAQLETYAEITGLLIDRLMHEREIIRERERLEQITAQLTDIVWRTDLQLNTTYISPSVKRTLGYSVEEYLELPVEKRYKPEQLDDFQLILKEELGKEMNSTTDKYRTRIIEMEQQKADGTFIPLELHISFVRNEQGNPTGLQGVSRDISERKLLENNLKQQTQLREILMQVSSEFINVALEKVDEIVLRSLESLGNFVDADRAYTFEYDWELQVCNNLYEWCREGIEPQLPNLQAVPLEMMPDWVDSHRQGKEMLVADVFNLPHGLVREILEPQGIKSVVSVPMMNEGLCIGFVGFDFVVQHRYFSDTEVQLLKIFAQMLVNVALRRDTEQQLVIAKERAEESDRLKTSFLTNLSHEIRTPMNGIIGFLNLLRQPELNSDDRASFIDIVNQSSDRLLNTINDIIEIARIESGDSKVEKQKVDLTRFFNHYYDYFTPMAYEKQVVLQPFRLHADKTHIYTDQSKLDSILTNLLKNAIKFTEHGSIEVGCNQEGDQDFLFYVKDTGKGIQPEKLELIFRQFVQEDGSFTRSHEGSGLGLSIAKAYVEALGGTIKVESEPGKGSNFYFTLPAGM